MEFVMAISSSPVQDAALSRRKLGFESPYGYNVKDHPQKAGGFYPAGQAGTETNRVSR